MVGGSLCWRGWSRLDGDSSEAQFHDRAMTIGSGKSPGEAEREAPSSGRDGEKEDAMGSKMGSRRGTVMEVTAGASR